MNTIKFNSPEQQFRPLTITLSSASDALAILIVASAAGISRLADGHEQAKDAIRELRREIDQHLSEHGLRAWVHTADGIVDNAEQEQLSERHQRLEAERNEFKAIIKLREDEISELKKLAQRRADELVSVGKIVDEQGVELTNLRRTNTDLVETLASIRTSNAELEGLNQAQTAELIQFRRENTKLAKNSSVPVKKIGNMYIAKPARKTRSNANKQKAD